MFSVTSMSSDVLKDAFIATVSRDYEKAVNVIRSAVSTEHAFNVEELELIDHVYSCILNTSHYDESLIEVCWEWIDAIERRPRIADPRVISSSQLSIYYAYHTICRVQERMPKRVTYPQTRTDTWNRITQSFSYLWKAATQLWKAYELDRLDVLCSWSYLCLQFADAVTDDVLSIIETSMESARSVLSSTIVVENSHQANQRVCTVERNAKDCRALAEKYGRKLLPSSLVKQEVITEVVAADEEEEAAEEDEEDDVTGEEEDDEPLGKKRKEDL
ncbi:unnamed protein product [Caenorhabditis auriculariae]|uniref:Uncharacterized protein n=1 Tax=Caenorhabditis auriculariae TaxID=2777116 RepID=A0A8S1GPS6_9PELO|nr:unnamed protein product [Caenorhabditis auriculariae]